MKFKPVLVLLLVILSNVIAESKEAGSISINCPQGFFVKGVVAQGAKAMSMVSGGLNDALTFNSNRCLSTHGWTIAISTVSLICSNPENHESVKVESAMDNDEPISAVDLKVFEDSAWFGNTTEARKLTQRDMSVECKSGEMVEFNTNVSMRDPFCQGTVELATKPFRCVNYSRDNPTTGFKLLKSNDSAIALMKLGQDILSSKAVQINNLEYLSFALPLSSEALSDPHFNIKDLKSHLDSLGEEFRISPERLKNPLVEKLLGLYLNLCHENRSGKEQLERRERNSNLLSIPGRKCWYPEDQIFDSKLNEVTREIEAILEAGLGTHSYVDDIEADMLTPSWNSVNVAEALFDKFGTNGVTAQQFEEGMAYFNSKPFAEKVQLTLERRKHSYLEWAFRLKLYKQFSEKSEIRYDIQKILKFSMIKMIAPILTATESRMDLNPQLSEQLKELYNLSVGH